MSALLGFLNKYKKWTLEYDLEDYPGSDVIGLFWTENGAFKAFDIVKSGNNVSQKIVTAMLIPGTLIVRPAEPDDYNRFEGFKNQSLRSYTNRAMLHINPPIMSPSPPSVEWSVDGKAGSQTFIRLHRMQGKPNPLPRAVKKKDGPWGGSTPF